MHAEAGGLFRNHKGDWILDFFKHYGLCTFVQAKLCGILLGLQIAHQMGYSNLIIETDSLLAMEAVNDDAQIFSNSRNLVSSARNLLHDNQNVKCVFQRRDSNFYADWLAKEGAMSRNPDISLLLSLPNGLRDLLAFDCNGISLNYVY